MTGLAIIGALGLIGLGIEIAVAVGIGRAIHQVSPVSERPIIIRRETTAVVVAIGRRGDLTDTHA